MVDEMKNGQPYHLDSQVGFTMRQANQRHLSIFARHIPELTPTQFAAIAKLCELGQASQNALGRATAMDAATIKGVVDRLRRRDLVASSPDPNDQRRVFLTPTDAGRALYDSVVQAAHAVTVETLSPLEPEEREVFLRLLRKMI